MSQTRRELVMATHCRIVDAASRSDAASAARTVSAWTFSQEKPGSHARRCTSTSDRNRRFSTSSRRPLRACSHSTTIGTSRRIRSPCCGTCSARSAGTGRPTTRRSATCARSSRSRVPNRRTTASTRRTSATSWRRSRHPVSCDRGGQPTTRSTRLAVLTSYPTYERLRRSNTRTPAEVETLLTKLTSAVASSAPATLTSVGATRDQSAGAKST